MVITEPLRTTDYDPMSQQGHTDDDEDTSSSDGSKKYSRDGGGRKRKYTNSDTGEPENIEEKRRKNRAAAKKCREKKQKQVQDLESSNKMLEQENMELVRQRDELITQCKVYEQEIQQHKEQGCSMQHLSLPFDVEELLYPSTPPPPSLNNSPCPSPAPSTSPAPSVSPTPSLHNHPETPAQMLQRIGVTNVRITEPGEPLANTIDISKTVDTSNYKSVEQVFFVRVRDGDKVRTLQFTKEQWERMQASKMGIKQPVHTQPMAQALSVPREQTAPVPRLHSAPRPIMQTTMSTSAMPSAQQFVQQSYIKTEPGIVALPNSMHSQQISLTNEQVDSTKKLDSITDVLSIMQGHANNGLVFVQDNDPEVQAMVKVEPPDYDDSRNDSSSVDYHKVAAIQRQLMDDSSSLAGPTFAGGQQQLTAASQIRESLNTVHNPEQGEYMQLMEQDDDCIIMATNNPVFVSGSQGQGMRRQTAPRSVASVTPSAAQSQAFSTNGKVRQGQVFVTSQAPLGSLQSATSQDAIAEPQLVIQAMQGGTQTSSRHPPGVVKLRQNARLLSVQISEPATSASHQIVNQHQPAVSSPQMIRVNTGQTQQRVNNSHWDASSKPATGKQVLISTVAPRSKVPAASKGMHQQQGITTVNMQQLQQLNGHVAMTSQQQLLADAMDQLDTGRDGLNEQESTEGQNLATFSTGQIQEYLANSSIESLYAFTSTS